MIAESWIDVLRSECDRTSMAAVSKRIRYSVPTISQILGGTYPSDTKSVKRAVEGALMGVEVDCPVIGSLPKQRCIEHQRAPFRATNPVAVQLHRTCPNCPNGGKR